MKSQKNRSRLVQLALILCITVMGCIALAGCTSKEESALVQSLKAIDGVTSVKEISQSEDVFKEKLMVTFTQPVDWNDPNGETFEQRVEIGWQDNSSVNVYYIGGYCLPDKIIGSDYLKTDDRNSLCKMLNGNYISIEYRFFGDSCPSGLSADSTEKWEYLTCENAAKDFHAVIEKLNSVLTGNKVITGESKGGFTTNTMAYYYPNDCDAFVSYVAPLCNGTEDTAFMDNVYNTIGNLGFSAEEAASKRQTIMDFEVYCIENRDVLQEKYWNAGKDAGASFRETVTKEILFDMGVMEFGLGYWQYGYDFGELQTMVQMPETNDNEREEKLTVAYTMLVTLAPPTNWSTSYAMFPYYVQTKMEMGSYRYDFTALREAVIAKTGKDMLTVSEEMENDLLYHVVLTEEQQQAFTYNSSLRDALIDWDNTTTAHVIQIYGGCDPWYAVRIPDTSNPNVHIFVKSDGCHTSDIDGLSESDRQACTALLESWLK